MSIKQTDIADRRFQRPRRGSVRGKTPPSERCDLGETLTAEVARRSESEHRTPLRLTAAVAA